ncbi:MAG: DUF2577 domain-containing protein [Roseburia sp.]|jgi:hypothetical protein|nr:DUF2577 domain-containing protein [Roseburia sp.]
MKGNPYSRILKTMERQGAKQNPLELTTGTVVSTEPLSIMFNGVTATDSVRCTLPHMDKKVMEEINKEENISSGLKTYLTEFNKAFNLDVGDKVMVQKVNNILYVLGKA